MNNSFAGYGKIGTGESYIHRRELETELENRTLNYQNFGSVSVVGMQRMGKSSLAYNVFSARADEYYPKGILITSVSMNNYSNADSFFRGIVDSVYELIDDNDGVDVRLEKRYQRVAESKLSDGGVKSIQGFFKYLLKSQRRVICVIDEFDYSRKIFAEFPEGFNILRELAYQPETNVTFVFISRRMVSELEASTGISTLANILGKPIYVKSYSDEDIRLYFSRLSKAGIRLSEDEKKELREITGYQPYWCDLIMNYYCNSVNAGISLDDVFDRNRGVLYTEYENMMKLLEEQSLLSPMFQIILGPAYDYTQSDVQKLYDYGIVHFENSRAKAISEKFYDYLKLREGSFDFYPLWNRTERNLRMLMKAKLREKYGENWEQRIKAAYIRPGTDDGCQMTLSKFLRYAVDLQSRVERQTDLYIQNASFSIVEGLTTAGLFALYIREYSLFEPVFSMTKDEFRKMTDHIAKARNPYQHNNDNLIDPAFKNITRGYCELILKKIDSVLNTD